MDYFNQLEEAIYLLESYGARPESLIIEVNESDWYRLLGYTRKANHVLNACNPFREIQVTAATFSFTLMGVRVTYAIREQLAYQDRREEERQARSEHYRRFMSGANPFADKADCIIEEPGEISPAAYAMIPPMCHYPQSINDEIARSLSAREAFVSSKSLSDRPSIAVSPDELYNAANVHREAKNDAAGSDEMAEDEA